MPRYWPFNKYPGTDYETFNWEWLIKLGKRMEQVLDDLFSNTGALHRMVNTVLSEHPEWVTTIMNGAITAGKIAPGFLKEIINPFVTPEMFGAVGDGQTDDTAAIQAACDDGKIVLFFDKNYKISDTINIQNKTILIGQGEDTTLTWNGDGLMFDVQTDYRIKTIIKNFNIVDMTNTNTQSFLKCDKRQWGGSVIVENVYINGFHDVVFDMKSVYASELNNIMIRSAGQIKYRPFDSSLSASLTPSNNNQMRNVYFTCLDQYKAVMLTLENVRDFRVVNSSFERAVKCFEMDATSNNIEFDSCWFEALTAIYTTANRLPEIHKCRTSSDIKYFDANNTAIDWFENFNNIQYFRGATGAAGDATMLRKLYAMTESLTEDEGIFFDRDLNVYKTLWQKTTQKEKSLLPRNMERIYFDGNTPLEYNLDQIVAREDISALYRIKAYVHYSGGSYNVLDIELLQTQQRYFTMKDPEFFYKSDWGTASHETADVTISSATLKINETGAHDFAYMLIEYEPIGVPLTPTNS